MVQGSIIYGNRSSLFSLEATSTSVSLMHIAREKIAFVDRNHTEHLWDMMSRRMSSLQSVPQILAVLSYEIEEASKKISITSSEPAYQ